MASCNPVSPKSNGNEAALTLSNVGVALLQHHKCPEALKMLKKAFAVIQTDCESTSEDSNKDDTLSPCLTEMCNKLLSQESSSRLTESGKPKKMHEAEDLFEVKFLSLSKSIGSLADGANENPSEMAGFALMMEDKDIDRSYGVELMRAIILNNIGTTCRKFACDLKYSEPDLEEFEKVQKKCTYYLRKGVSACKDASDIIEQLMEVEDCDDKRLQLAQLSLLVFQNIHMLYSSIGKKKLARSYYCAIGDLRDELSSTNCESSSRHPSLRATAA